MKSYEDICKELQFFKNLKPEEREGELKKLAEKRAGLGDEIASNLKSIGEAERKLRSAEAKKEAIEIEYTETRQKRQNAIALGRDPEKFSTSISALQDARELQEDTCIGLQKRIEDLRTEGELLEQEKSETEKTILQFRVIPLVEQWNEHAGKSARVLEQIVRLSSELGQGFSEFSSGEKTVLFSSWEGISRIAKLYLVGCIGPQDTWENGRLKDIFNIRDLYAEFQKEREKVVVT